MKRLFLTVSALAAALVMAASAAAAEKKRNANQDPNAPRTIRGVGLCAKCELKEADKCQAIIQVKAKNRQGEEITRNIILADNEVAKGAHKELFCSGKNPVTAKGTIQREGRGKNAKVTLTATEIKAGKAEQEKRGKKKQQ